MTLIVKCTSAHFKRFSECLVIIFSSLWTLSTAKHIKIFNLAGCQWLFVCFQLWEARSHAKTKDWAQTWSTAEARILMTVLQDQVSVRQRHSGELQHALLLPGLQTPPRFLIGWVLWGYNLLGHCLSPESLRVFFLLPSHPKPTFINKDFSLFPPKHPVSLSILQE